MVKYISKGNQIVVKGKTPKKEPVSKVTPINNKSDKSLSDLEIEFKKTQKGDGSSNSPKDQPDVLVR